MLLGWTLLNGYDDDGKPKKGTTEALAILQGVLKDEPENSAANHFWIHAVEASPKPEQAAAQRGNSCPPRARVRPHGPHARPHLLSHGRIRHRRQILRRFHRRRRNLHASASTSASTTTGTTSTTSCTRSPTCWKKAASPTPRNSPQNSKARAANPARLSTYNRRATPSRASIRDCLLLCAPPTGPTFSKC